MDSEEFQALLAAIDDLACSNRELAEAVRRNTESRLEEDEDVVMEDE